jgi:hypothetical protein
MSIIEALEKEIEDLREFKKQWDEKDGNSPGYNLEKAKTYGRIGQILKDQLESVQLQLIKHMTRLQAIIQRGDASEADIDLFQETTLFLELLNQTTIPPLPEKEFDEDTAKARANAYTDKCTDCGNVPSRTYRIYMAGQRAQHNAMTTPIPEIKSLAESWLATYERDKSIYNSGASKVARKVLRIIGENIPASTLTKKVGKWYIFHNDRMSDVNGQKCIIEEVHQDEEKYSALFANNRRMIVYDSELTIDPEDCEHEMTPEPGCPNCDEWIRRGK